MTGERLDGAVQRPGLMVGDERERGAPRLAVQIEADEVADRHEARVRLGVIAHVCGDHGQPVERRRALARDRSFGRVAVRRDLSCRVARRGRGDRRRPRHLREELPALVEGDGMRADDANLLERDALGGHEQVADRKHGLRRDRERRAVQQVVRLGDRARQRALDRQHAERDRAARRRLDDRVERRQRDELRVREEAVAGCGAVRAVAAGVADAGVGIDCRCGARHGATSWREVDPPGEG